MQRQSWQSELLKLDEELEKQEEEDQTGTRNSDFRASLRNNLNDAPGGSASGSGLATSAGAGTGSTATLPVTAAAPARVVRRTSQSLDGFILHRLRGNAAARWSVSEESLRSQASRSCSMVSLGSCSAVSCSSRSAGNDDTSKREEDEEESEDEEEEEESEAQQEQAHVTFCFQPPQIQVIPSVHDYSEQELNDLYYTEEDHEDMLEDARIMAMGWITQWDTNRGLERFTEEGQQQCKQKRQFVIATVLEKQRELQEEGFVFGMDRPKVIAEVAQTLSAPCQDLAYERAYQDELEILPRQRHSVPVPPKPGLISTLKQYRWGSII